MRHLKFSPRTIQFTSCLLLLAFIAGGVTRDTARAQSMSAAQLKNQKAALPHTFATGTELITKRRKIYGTGILMRGGILMSD